MSANDIKYLVLHCSASRCNQDYSVELLRRDHKARGFYDIGYHFYIRKDGKKTQHRMLLEVGAHCIPYNRCSIGICYEGGLDEDGKPANTLTKEQEERITDLLINLHKTFQRRRLWGIVICLVLRLRSVHASMLMLSLDGLRICNYSSAMASRKLRSISMVAPLIYLISLPMVAFLPDRRCTYASNPANFPSVILTF